MAANSASMPTAGTQPYGSGTEQGPAQNGAVLVTEPDGHGGALGVVVGGGAEHRRRAVLGRQLTAIERVDEVRRNPSVRHELGGGDTHQPEQRRHQHQGEQPTTTIPRRQPQRHG